jgi:ATP adenylyltransferase
MTSVLPGLSKFHESDTATCRFCRTLRDGSPGELCVLADDTFVAWVSAGALVEGHLLIVPRRHVLNLRALTSSEKEHLGRFSERTQRLLARHYVAPSMFEHGPACPGTAVGCSVDHAHLHLVPFGSSLVEAALTDYGELPWQPVEGGIGSWLAGRGREPYLAVQDPDMRTIVASSDVIPSQALRRTVALRTGRSEEWNWRDHLNRKAMTRTAETLLSEG